MSDHSDLVQAAKDAIDEVFGDTSVDNGQTVESLEEIKDEIESKIMALRE